MNMRVIRIGWILLLAAGLARPAIGQDQRIMFSFFGGLNKVMEYGSVDDYILGENDFPVTPSHTPACFGAAFGISLFGGLGLEVDGRYFSGSQVVLEDPSDGDRLTLDTTKHVSLTANLIFRMGSGRLQPYLLAGAGIDSLSGAEEQTLISENGYEITLIPPADTTDWIFNAGGGLTYWMTSRLGLRLDLRYVLIPGAEDLPSVTSWNAVAGLAVRF